MLQKQKGFTLIELLVVIAIIAILAAMLFPVFARARESARKIQCLSNVKNIVMAFQLYFTDYDRYPPGQHDAAVNQFFAGKGCTVTPGCCTNPANVDPYLRWPVIIDEYIKNRDIWRCPSARWPAAAQRVYGQVDWWKELQDNWPTCACGESWPHGWGGTMTDNMALVGGCPGVDGNSDTIDQGAFEVDYSDTHAMYGEVDKKLSAIDDPAKTIIIAERGIDGSFDRIEKIAYPEICRISWYEVAVGSCLGSGTPPQDVTQDQIYNFWNDASWRNKYTRHMGGNNLGFTDGHAAWMAADAMIAAANAGQLAPMGPLHVPDDVPGYHG